MINGRDYTVPNDPTHAHVAGARMTGSASRMPDGAFRPAMVWRSIVGVARVLSIDTDLGPDLSLRPTTPSLTMAFGVSSLPLTTPREHRSPRCSRATVSDKVPMTPVNSRNDYNAHQCCVSTGARPRETSHVTLLPAFFSTQGVEQSGSSAAFSTWYAFCAN
jgi:hypothetical protein